MLEKPRIEVNAKESAAPSLHMTYDEFLAWADEDVHAEWVPVNIHGVGEVIVQMPPKYTHQAVVGFLYGLLKAFVETFGLGEMLVAPFEVKLSTGSSREPDILFVAREHADRLTEARVVGPPDLVVEVVSRDSVKRDRSDKYHEYRDAGVREYWVIDPRDGQRRADFFALDEAGEYHLFATEEDARVESRVLPGFWLHPEWLWQVDKLNPLHLLLEIRGVSPEEIQRIDALLKRPEATEDRQAQA
jgi:Uma2 family endonuclease